MVEQLVYNLVEKLNNYSLKRFNYGTVCNNKRVL